MIKQTKFGYEYLVKVMVQCSLCATLNIVRGWYKQTESVYKASKDCLKCKAPYYFVIPPKMRLTLPIEQESI